MKLVFEKRVDSDFNVIRKYIEKDSPINAARFLDKLEAHCRKLAVTPFIGRARDDLAPNLRSVTFGNYLILYRVTADEVQIAAVLHGARDIARALSDPDK